MSLPHATCRGLSITLFTLATALAVDESPPPQITDLLQRIEALERRGAQTPAGASRFRLTDLSLILLATGGASTARDAQIAELQGGGHDPSRRGFTFQGAELSIAGIVDPFFTVQTHFVAIRAEPDGTTGIEMEEAFARTTALPGGLEAKLGQYLLEFGRFNPTHPHAWQFIDQPVILSRVFGGDGQRSPGARMLWSAPTAWLSEVIVGVQNANGENAPSFLANSDVGTIGGRPFVERDTASLGSMLWNARWINSFDVGDSIGKAGLSGATGPNAAGERTDLWGADLAFRWHPTGGERGWPFVIVEAEYIARTYATNMANLVDDTDAVIGTAAASTLRDSGIVAQVVYGFHSGWATGIRAERCTGGGNDIITVDNGAGGTVQQLGGRGANPLRDDRTRLSALLSWQPSEFTHLRLQYNFDRADHLDKATHSVWLGFEFLIGTHPAHTF